MVQKADVNASLEAARSVLASQCDAEAGKGHWLDDQGESFGCIGIGPRLYIYIYRYNYMKYIYIYITF